jgi:hypothetical protein
MCNCGKKRVVASGPGASRTGGCVGPDCPPGLLPPPSQPRPVAGTIPVAYRRREPVIVNRRAAPAPAPAAPEPVDVGLPIVDPALWGPHLWRFLHVAAALSPPRVQAREKWRALLNALRTSLPCPECTGHYQAWLREHPFRVMMGGIAVRRAAMRWVADLHNDVNRRRGLQQWSTRQIEASVEGAGVAEARAALEAAIAAGVGAGVRGPAEALCASQA